MMLDFLRAVHRFYLNCLKKPFLWWKDIIIARHRYSKLEKKVRSAYGKRKLVVIFPLSNTAKWKVQSLYDAMANSDKFYPIVAITPMDIEYGLTLDKKIAALSAVREFLNERGCHYVEAYDKETGVCLSFAKYKPDIVWYTQPWNIDQRQDVLETSRYALSCYTPYYLQNFGCLDMECGILFMRLLWKNFAMNEEWADVCLRYQGKMRAGCSIGLGHPMLDLFKKAKCVAKRKMIIYAPHWSCGIGECISTFLLNGYEILEIARQHKEFQWVFKPHPSLRKVLVDSCNWSEDKVQRYYDAWKEVGLLCLDGNYVDLFLASSVLITDCGSFLVEYPCTGHPIIHLVSADCKCSIHPISRKLFATYYQVHDMDEFRMWFEMVVLNGIDPKREDRMRVVRQMRLGHNNAALNILCYLDECLRAK